MDPISQLSLLQPHRLRWYSCDNLPRVVRKVGSTVGILTRSRFKSSSQVSSGVERGDRKHGFGGWLRSD